MFHNKYLPEYHFNAIHAITVSAAAEKIFDVIREFDFSESSLIRMLFKLRGLPTATAYGINGVEAMGFTRLDLSENKELILGLIGQFWKLNGNIIRFTPSQFIPFNDPGFVKATWNFELTPLPMATQTVYTVTTETRICCLSEKTRRKFSRYWLFIRPFSALIRQEMLRSIKRKAED